MNPGSRGLKVSDSRWVSSWTWPARRGQQSGNWSFQHPQLRFTAQDPNRCVCVCVFWNWASPAGRVVCWLLEAPKRQPLMLRRHVRASIPGPVSIILLCQEVGHLDHPLPCFRRWQPSGQEHELKRFLPELATVPLAEDAQTLS